MILRVAKLVAENTNECSGERLPCTSEADCDCWKTARAGIEAMRKPTKEMLVAGDEATWEPSSDRPYVGETTLETAWSAMIDAALK